MQNARSVGPLEKFFRAAALVLLLLGAFAVYWNFDALKQMRFDFSRVTGAFEDAADEVQEARRGDELGTEVVGDTRIAGVSMPTSVDGEPPPGDVAAEQPAAAAAGERAAPANAQAPPAGEAAPAAEAGGETAPPKPDENAAAVADAGRAPVTPEPEPAPQAPPEPEVPPGPEMFGFGLHTMNVAESDASAAVLALRDGGRRAVAFITWWTTDGTATAGSDFARLEPRVERFGTGEQNRALYVPIIGDRAAEGPENFFLHIAVGDSGRAENAVAQIEVIIDDDD
jgi:hypothetical protein